MDIIGESNNMPLIWEMAREKEVLSIVLRKFLQTS